MGYARDQQIAAEVAGIDVIVGGHSHTLLSSTDEKALGPYPTLVKNPDGKDVPIVQAYAYSKYLGELAVVWDDAGNVVSASGAPLLLDASVTPEPLPWWRGSRKWARRSRPSRRRWSVRPPN